MQRIYWADARSIERISCFIIKFIIFKIITLLWKHSCKISRITCNNCKDHWCGLG